MLRYNKRGEVTEMKLCYGNDRWCYGNDTWTNINIFDSLLEQEQIRN